MLTKAVEQLSWVKCGILAVPMINQKNKYAIYMSTFCVFSIDMGVKFVLRNFTFQKINKNGNNLKI